MITRQKFIFSLLLLFVVTVSDAQNLTFGGTINLGPSVVTSNEPTDGTFRTKAAFSGNFGMFMEKKISKNASLGIEGLWVQMEGYKVIENVEYFIHLGWNDNEKIGFITEEYNYHTSYLGLPIYFRYNIGKFGIKSGMQTLFLLRTSTHARSYGELYDEPFDSEGKAKPLELSSMDFGPKIGIDYQISPKLRILMDYYHGIQDINADRWEWIRKNRQLSVGISYTFSKKEEIKDEAKEVMQ